MEDCTVTSDLQGKQKLHLRIQTLITATYLEGTIINYIYSCSPRTGDSFGGGHISVHYSIRKLQYVIEKRAIKSCKNCLQRDISACILSYNNSIAINFIYMDLKAISCRIEWSLFQVHSTKHAQVIFIINLITKPLVALRRQRANELSILHRVLSLCNMLTIVHG